MVGGVKPPAAGPAPSPAPAEPLTAPSPSKKDTPQADPLLARALIAEPQASTFEMGRTPRDLYGSLVDTAMIEAGGAHLPPAERAIIKKALLQIYGRQGPVIAALSDPANVEVRGVLRLLVAAGAYPLNVGYLAVLRDGSDPLLRKSAEELLRQLHSPNPTAAFSTEVTLSHKRGHLQPKLGELGAAATDSQRALLAASAFGSLLRALATGSPSAESIATRAGLPLAKIIDDARLDANVRRLVLAGGTPKEIVARAVAIGLPGSTVRKVETAALTMNAELQAEPLPPAAQQVFRSSQPFSLATLDPQALQWLMSVWTASGADPRQVLAAIPRDRPLDAEALAALSARTDTSMRLLGELVIAHPVWRTTSHRELDPYALVSAYAEETGQPLLADAPLDRAALARAETKAAASPLRLTEVADRKVVLVGKTAFISDSVAWSHEIDDALRRSHATTLPWGTREIRGVELAELAQQEPIAALKLGLVLLRKGAGKITHVERRLTGDELREWAFLVVPEDKRGPFERVARALDRDEDALSSIDETFAEDGTQATRDRNIVLGVLRDVTKNMYDNRVTTSEDMLAVARTGAAYRPVAEFAHPLAFSLSLHEGKPNPQSRRSLSTADFARIKGPDTVKRAIEEGRLVVSDQGIRSTPRDFAIEAEARALVAQICAAGDALQHRRKDSESGVLDRTWAQASVQLFTTPKVGGEGDVSAADDRHVLALKIEMKKAVSVAEMTRTPSDPPAPMSEAESARADALVAIDPAFLRHLVTTHPRAFDPVFFGMIEHGRVTESDVSPQLLRDRVLRAAQRGQTWKSLGVLPGDDAETREAKRLVQLALRNLALGDSALKREASATLDAAAALWGATEGAAGALETKLVLDGFLALGDAGTLDGPQLGPMVLSAAASAARERAEALKAAGRTEMATQLAKDCARLQRLAEQGQSVAFDPTANDAANQALRRVSFALGENRRGRNEAAAFDFSTLLPAGVEALVVTGPMHNARLSADDAPRTFDEAAKRVGREMARSEVEAIDSAQWRARARFDGTRMIASALALATQFKTTMPVEISYGLSITFARELTAATRRFAGAKTQEEREDAVDDAEVAVRNWVSTMAAFFGWHIGTAPLGDAIESARKGDLTHAGAQAIATGSMAYGAFKGLPWLARRTLARLAREAPATNRVRLVDFGPAAPKNAVAPALPKRVTSAILETVTKPFETAKSLPAVVRSLRAVSVAGAQTTLDVKAAAQQVRHAPAGAIRLATDAATHTVDNRLLLKAAEEVATHGKISAETARALGAHEGPLADSVKALVGELAEKPAALPDTPPPPVRTVDPTTWAHRLKTSLNRAGVKNVSARLVTGVREASKSPGVWLLLTIEGVQMTIAVGQAWHESEANRWERTLLAGARQAGKSGTMVAFGVWLSRAMPGVARGLGRAGFISMALDAENIAATVYSAVTGTKSRLENVAAWRARGLPETVYLRIDEAEGLFAPDDRAALERNQGDLSSIRIDHLMMREDAEIWRRLQQLGASIDKPETFDPKKVTTFKEPPSSVLQWLRTREKAADLAAFEAKTLARAETALENVQLEDGTRRIFVDRDQIVALLQANDRFSVAAEQAGDVAQRVQDEAQIVVQWAALLDQTQVSEDEKREALRQLILGMAARHRATSLIAATVNERDRSRAQYTADLYLLLDPQTSN